MDDLISRQAAIDAMGKAKWAKERLMELPSVQPDHVADIGKKVEGDCISRQAAVDAVSEYATIWMSYTDDMSASEIAEEAFSAARDTMIRIMREQPAVQPEPHWIPCSERLPEEDTEVLISYRYKEGEGDTDHVNIDITSYGTTCFGGREIHTLKEWRQPFDYFHANYEVIAWMPLPEPYKGGDSE